MLIRIARFYETPPGGREWITEALQGVPGVRSAYHAQPTDGTGDISVSILDDREAGERAAAAIAERREQLGLAGHGPDDVAVYVVTDFAENA